MTLNGILIIWRTILIRTLPYDKETETFEIIPLDELLGIDKLPFKMTKLVMIEVAYMAQMLNSYEEATIELQKKLGYEISCTLVRQVTIFVGLLVYQNDLRKAVYLEENMINSIPDIKEKIKGELNILIDGAAVNTRVQDKNGSTWRENKLGMSFASVNVIKRGHSEKSGNIITKKEYTAYIGSAEEFAKFLYLIAINQGYGKYETTNVLGDGAVWIWNLAELLFPDAILTLDLFHLKENIYEFAKHIFKNDEKKYTVWAEIIITYIWNEDIDKVIDEVKKYSKIKLPKGVVNLKNYIENNRNKFNYKEKREKGFLIGSGPIESGNKTVLQRRFKQSGMRWSPETAQPLLTLRAKVESGRWDEVKQLVMNL
jgi:hypothetical protein